MNTASTEKVGQFIKLCWWSLVIVSRARSRFNSYPGLDVHLFSFIFSSCLWDFINILVCLLLSKLSKLQTHVSGINKFATYIAWDLLLGSPWQVPLRLMLVSLFFSPKSSLVFKIKSIHLILLSHLFLPRSVHKLSRGELFCLS